MQISRREFAGTAAIALRSFLPLTANGKAKPYFDPARSLFPLDGDWLFGGKFSEDALQPEFKDRDFSKITLPHCVAKLSWQNWNPAEWEDVWIYRRHFAAPREFNNQRVFLQFDAVMVGARPVINGHALPEHLGGYLPFQYEITSWLRRGHNVLAVAVDARWKNVPPEGSPKGPRSIDYLEPGGIVRSVALRAVPPVFVSDVFAKPVNVLDPGRRVDVVCTVDAGTLVAKPVRIKVELLDGDRVISRAQHELKLQTTGPTEAQLSLSNLGNIGLWDIDTPRLYNIVTSLSVDGKAWHEHRTRIGFREARFEVDGFFLNGRRLQIFGLNRHELYPYAGGAMPRRTLRKDAEILRRELNCNFVRCSHYPQSEAFLEACDELGLMVWEELPGWQYLGDEVWRELAVRDVRDMVRRDRNHAAIVIWGVRINESPNDPALYQRTKEAAKSLDDSRPASGTMTPSSLKTWREAWHQDVFAFDDYHSAPDGSVGILEPLPGVPYMIAEAVGQFSYAEHKGFNAKYRRAGDVAIQQAQALRHAQAHDRGMSFARCSGVVAWCGFEYGSLINAYAGVKYPGVCDIFRVPKLGASFYEAQADPQARPVIQPNFYWEFGAQTPHGPGKNAAIFSNCERLEVFIDGKRVAVLRPDRANYPRLTYPPFFCDLDVQGAGTPELRIDGYIGDRLALSKSFSSDTTKDQFLLTPDDSELMGDGSDATRLVFRTADQFGATRPFAGGEVSFSIAGPGSILGDNPFRLAESGGVGAIWIKTAPKSSGSITVKATHSVLGAKAVEIKVRQGGV